MANDYFNHENPLTRHTLGRAEQVNSTFNAIEAAFDKLPSPDQINRGSVAYVTDIGTVNSYVVNFARVPESYTEGMNFTMKAATTNTGPAVINVNGLGAKQIRRYDGQPLEPGDIREGQLVILGYDGSRFLIVGVHGAEVAKARQWATSTSVVQSGEYGARGYAQQADRWANENEDVVVEGGRYSAKHWALKAMSNAGLLPDENLDIPSRSYRDLGTDAEKFRDGNFSRNVSAAAFVGSGAGLTDLNASNLTTGTLPSGRLSGSYSFGSLTLSSNLTVGGTATINGFLYTNAIRMDAGTQAIRNEGMYLDLDPAGDESARVRFFRHSDPELAGYMVTFHEGEASAWLTFSSNSGITLSTGKYTGDGSGLTNLNASNISSGTLPAARLPNHSAGLLTSGTLPNARLSGDYSFANLTLSGALSAGGGVTAGGNLVSQAARVLGDGTILYIAPATGNENGRTVVIRPRGTDTASVDTIFQNNGNVEITGGSLLAPSGGVSTRHLRLGSGTSYAIHRNTDNSWLELAGGDDAGKGAVIRLYGPDNNDDGRLMQGGNTHLSWGSFGVRVDNGAGGLLPVATVSQATSHGTTVFPIGHILATENDPGDINRNQSATIRLSDNNAREYRANVGSGDVLGGVWRSRGAGISGVAFERVE